MSINVIFLPNVIHKISTNCGLFSVCWLSVHLCGGQGFEHSVKSNQSFCMWHVCCSLSAWCDTPATGKNKFVMMASTEPSFSVLLIECTGFMAPCYHLWFQVLYRICLCYFCYSYFWPCHIIIVLIGFVKHVITKTMLQKCKTYGCFWEYACMSTLWLTMLHFPYLMLLLP